MGEGRKVYIVEAMGGDGCAMVAAFSDPADAAAYATILTDSAMVVGCDAVFRTAAAVPLDLPREEW